MTSTLLAFVDETRRKSDDSLRKTAIKLLCAYILSQALQRLVVKGEHVVLQALVPSTAMVRVNRIDPFLLSDPA